MSSDRWIEVKPLLAKALDLPLARRRDFLGQLEDSELRSELESYLELEDGIETLLEEPVLDLLAGRPPEYRAGQRIGSYQLEGEIARGGMGVVYRARRIEGGFEQKVAIKVLKRGYDTSDFVRRFRTEQRVLAKLDHPYIARLYDGGATEDGLPYLVMEQIEGSRLDDYCREGDLDLEQRLELFSRICSAVHAAHQHLVVHCDLKPSNILVTSAGEPKLLDFGIAKVLSPDHGAATRTMSLRLGTLPYASPEQVSGNPITIASDVYSLGAILFLLLANRPPDHPHRNGALPKLPSRASAASDEGVLAKESNSSRRSLDAIVVKAMRRPPSERYASVAALREDLRRYRDQLPIQARTLTWSYAFRLFLGRHRGKLAAAGLLALVSGLAAAKGLELAFKARLEAARAEDMRSAYLEMIEVMDPTADESPAAAARSALDELLVSESLQRLERPAEIYDRLGRLFFRLERFEASQELLERALSLRQSRAEPVLEEQAKSLNNLALVLRERGELDRAARLLNLAASLYESNPGWGKAERLDLLHNLASLEQSLGRLERAEELYRMALAQRRDFYGVESREAARTAMNLGVLLLETHRLDEAEPLLLEAARLRELHYGSEHPKFATVLICLATLQDARGQYTEAISTGRAALAIRKTQLGEDSSSTARARSALAFSLLGRGLPDDLFEAKAELEQALSDNLRSRGPNHESTLVFKRNLAAVLLELRELDAAEGLLQEVEAAAEERPTASTWRIADARNLLGAVLMAQDRLDEAGPLLSGTWEVIARQRGADSRYGREARERWRDWLEAVGGV